MTKLTSYQLFVLTLLFQVGSTIVFGFASGSGRDAWITSLVSAVLGTGLIVLYTRLQKLQPKDSLVQWFPAQFGRVIGTVIAWLYPLAFLYVAARVLRDFGDLLATTILAQTPFWAIEGLYMLLISFGLLYGIDTLARVGEILFPVVLALLVALEVMLLASSHILHFERLLPILEHGWMSVWKSIWPLNLTVPFGETIVFAMFWSQAKQPKQVGRVTLAATLLYGVMISTADALAVAGLGEDIFKKSNYPLLTLLRQIEVGDFLEHLDAIIILQGIAIGFFKISLFMMGAIHGMRQLTGVREHRQKWLVLVAAGVVMLLAVIMASNVVEHMQVGLKVVPRVLWVPLFLVLPLLLFVVTLIRKKAQQAK
ncbi:MAG: GerAB/ArcD/ProY family transporter [Tumebacillaceae bacterium]